MLEIAGLQVCYDSYQVLWGVDLTVNDREIVAVLGPNGAGKSTVVNTISGLVSSAAGTITFRGERIDRLPTHTIVRRGIAHVLERHRVFPLLSIRDNLKLGSYQEHARARRQESLAWVFELFPVLAQRADQLANSLSGGEQQQLAIGRGLMSRPGLLMLDEPLLGLSPKMTDEVMETISKLRSHGMTILFIEQNVEQALALSDRAYILESGRVALGGLSSDLLSDERVREVYLGVA